MDRITAFVVGCAFFMLVTGVVMWGIAAGFCMNLWGIVGQTSEETCRNQGAACFIAGSVLLIGAFCFASYIKYAAKKRPEDIGVPGASGAKHSWSGTQTSRWW